MREPSGHLTLGDLRNFLKEHDNAPDSIPVTISVDTQFRCEEGGKEHEGSVFECCNACNILFWGFEEEEGASVDGYIPPEDWEPGENWNFSIQLVMRPEEAHNLLADCDHEVPD